MQVRVQKYCSNYTDKSTNFYISLVDYLSQFQYSSKTSYNRIKILVTESDQQNQHSARQIVSTFGSWHARP